MARILCERSIYDDECLLGKEACDTACIWGREAKNLYNAGYRKVNEVRKETAKEILHGLLSLFPSDKNYTTISRITIKSIAKKYGVEIKE